MPNAWAASRPSPLQAASHAPPPSGMPSPDYLVIIDLEACGDDAYNVNRQEITEWPWLVYDVRTRLVVDEKQVYIAPQWSPNPNPSPDAVVGLDEDVAFAPSLKDAVQKFDTYVYRSFVVHGKTYCLLTDGHWDLREMLLLESARKAVPLAPHFRTFFDLRTEFKRCYPTVTVPGDRQGLVDFLQIPVSGDVSVLENCRIIAQAVSRLQRDAHIFTTPEVIPEFNWAAMSARVPAVSIPVAAAVPVGGIVRLRGLPWTCVEQDIVDFFDGIPIVPKGIHFVKNAHGKATGEAFVQLHEISHVQLALRRHKKVMGRRYIEVFKSNPVDMSNHLGRADARRQLHQQQVMHAQAHKAAAAAAANAANAAAAAAVAAQHSARTPGMTMLPSGLPYGPPLYGQVPPMGLPQAQQNVYSSHSQLGSPQPQQQTQRIIQPLPAGGQQQQTSRSLATIPVHHQQLEQRRGHANSAANVPGSGTGKSYVLQLHGLPPSVSPEDIVRMFEGLEMLGNGVHLVPGRDGAPCCGNAFVEFTSESWMKKALARSPLAFGDSSVVVGRSSMNELSSTLYSISNNGTSGLSIDPASRARRVSLPSQKDNVVPSVSSASAVVDAVLLRDNAMSASADDGSQVGRVTGLAPGTSKDDIVQLFEGYKLCENGVFICETKDRSVMVAYLAFQSGEERKKAVARFAGRQKRSSGPGGPSMPPSDGVVVSTSEDDLARPGGVAPGDDICGCVIRLSGLPSRCCEADIGDFFSGLEIVDSGIPDNSGSSSSSSAWVRLLNAEQADFARRHLADKLVQGRNIRLRVV